MNASTYCFNKAALPGSAFYYSHKKLPKNQREAVVAIQAFYLELEEVIFHFTDLGVAQARLHWWREEVVKVHRGTPDHPVSICLQKNKVNAEQLLLLIDGFEQCLSYLSFATYDEVVVHLMRTAGVREYLFADVTSDGNKLEIETLYQAMLVIELTSYLQQFRRFMARDLIYFSEDELKKFQLKRSDFLGCKTTTNIKSLFEFQAQKIRRAHAGLPLLPPMLQARVNIACHVLKELTESDFQVLEQFIDLTALKRWWITMKG